MPNLENKFMRMQTNQLMELKRQNEAREARVKSAEMRNKLITYQKHKNILTEYEQIRNHLEKKTIPHLTKADLENRIKKIDMALFGLKN